jgi:aspartyl-tRNA(Asn)/glutamyl-tRNA(Gln) amidotransferase subunit C
MSTTISKDDIVKLAKLSGLTVGENEIEDLSKRFSETITYVNILNELDTTKVSEKIHMSFASNVFFEDGTGNKRLLSKKEALSNAPNNVFEVKKVLSEK